MNDSLIPGCVDCNSANDWWGRLALKKIVLCSQAMGIFVTQVLSENSTARNLAHISE